MPFDNTNPVDLAALKAEMTIDPNGYGLDPANTNDGLAALNLRRPEIIIWKPRISPSAVRSATTYQAFRTLATAEENWLKWMTGSGTGNGFGSDETLIVTVDVRRKLTGTIDIGVPGGVAIWDSAHAAAMIPAMLALIDVAGSRAEALFGYGTALSRNDWLAARDYVE